MVKIVNKPAMMIVNRRLEIHGNADIVMELVGMDGERGIYFTGGSAIVVTYFFVRKILKYILISTIFIYPSHFSI